MDKELTLKKRLDWQRLLLFCVLVIFVFTGCKKPEVSIIAGTEPGNPATFGLSKLKEVLNEKNIKFEEVNSIPEARGNSIVVTGLSPDGGVASQLLKNAGQQGPEVPEAFSIWKTESETKPVFVVCGYDNTGLMYALLDLAEQIQWQKNNKVDFALIENKTEKPFLKDRAVSIYTMHRKYFESRLYDEAHWERYFSMLAQSRINSFKIIFGYENGGFMAPVYPFFFNLEEFPEVKLNNITPEQQHKNTGAFNRMIEIAHAHGIKVTPAIWDHIYRGNVQSGGIDTGNQTHGHLVTGVTAENLVSYNKAALGKFLEIFPEIDGLQFRMHDESGLSHDEIPVFWHDIFAHILKVRPDLQIDLRAKGLPDEVIDDAVAQGLKFRVATKYWMEQMGLPFHPMHIPVDDQTNRRHGYADLLRFPQRYKVHWRLWSGGTARCLLWGDPDYVKRFAESARLYDGESFEVNEMMATWMLGEDHESEPRALLNEGYNTFNYEFERYWHYYQVWGRVSYNPEITGELWKYTFQQKFGETAGLQIMEALHLGSQVLPRIVASAYGYFNFPTTRGWIEMMAQRDLPTFASVKNSDVQLFQSFADAAQTSVIGGTTAQVTPMQNSKWFAQVSEAIFEKVYSALENQPGETSPEFKTTVTDLKILAALAKYYAVRIPAAVQYNIYLQTGHSFALKEAMEGEKQAIAAWQEIVDAAGEVYTKNMAFGVVGFPRHWRDELALLNESLKNLQAEYEKVSSEPVRAILTEPKVLKYMEDSFPATVFFEPAENVVPLRPFRVFATVADADGINSVKLRYRHLTQFEDYNTLEMKPDTKSEKWVATIPGDFIVPEWNLMYFIEVTDQKGNGKMFPDFEKVAPYIIVELDRN